MKKNRHLVSYYMTILWALVPSFQISCYPAKEKNSDKNIQKADKDNLTFVEKRMDDNEFNMHLWFCSVEDHIFMAKYIYEKENESLPKLVFISEKNRNTIIGLDRYEKFQSSLAASFDLKNNAIQSNSLIEFIIIVANQIDAYLRLSIVMKMQLSGKTNSFDLKYFYQGEDDKAIMERAIYKEANKLGILSDAVFDDLEVLYKKRNKIVHRYVISELRTKDLRHIAFEYETASEKIRLIMKDLEDLQRTQKIGIYRESLEPEKEMGKQELKLFFAEINDKHLTENFKRDI